MKDYILGGALVIGALIIGGVVYFTNTEEETVNLSSIVESTDTGYTRAEMKDNFVGGCMGEDASYVYCACAFDEFAKGKSNSEIMKMSLDFVDTGEIEKDILNRVVDNCLSKF
jgi:hypothetical protein